MTVKCTTALFPARTGAGEKLRAGTAVKNMREVHKAEECITATTTQRSKHLLLFLVFLQRS